MVPKISIDNSYRLTKKKEFIEPLKRVFDRDGSQALDLFGLGLLGLDGFQARGLVVDHLGEGRTKVIEPGVVAVVEFDQYVLRAFYDFPNNSRNKNNKV